MKKTRCGPVSNTTIVSLSRPSKNSFLKDLQGFVGPEKVSGTMKKIASYLITVSNSKGTDMVKPIPKALILGSYFRNAKRSIGQLLEGVFY
nr:hypothetical protein [Pedobacter sp. ASV2]